MGHAQTAHAGADVVVASGFSIPESVAVDGNGDVFVADSLNNTAYEIVAGSNGNPAGVVSASSTVNTIGSGFSSPAGVAVDAIGDVFVADFGHNAVKEIVGGSNGNPAGVVSSSSTVNTIGSGFNSPTGVAVDGSGDVFVADPNNNAVYEIVAVSGAVSSGSAVNPIDIGFSSPTGVSVDGSGDVFVADDNNNAVYEIVAASGVVSSSSTVNTLSTGGMPSDVAVDGSGNVFVANLTGAGTVALKATQAATSSYSSATAETTINVAEQPSATLVSTGATTIAPNQSVTLTAAVSATISGTAAMPTGTVTFLDNGTALSAAVNLVNGVATLVMPSLPPAMTALITAVYAGDANFLGSASSNSASVVVAAPQGFTFTDTGASAYRAAPGATAA